MSASNPVRPFKALQDADLYNSATAVTPSDSALIPVTRAIYIGVAGDLKVTMADGSVITFANAPLGVMRLQVNQVFATGTAATNIVALY